jgi:hypothetical protein
MRIAAPQTRFTAADYLTWEAEQPERHDFLDGEVFALAGAEVWHVTVALSSATTAACQAWRNICW